jgi:threonine synthase
MDTGACSATSFAHEVEKESNGWFDALSDADILSAQKLLTEQEGIFCEPASATSLAGAMRDIKSGKIPKGSTIVCWHQEQLFVKICFLNLKSQIKHRLCKFFPCCFYHK